MQKATTKRTNRDGNKASVRILQWLFAILIIILITSGLWNSVFAKTSSALSNEFIPVVLDSENRADYSQDARKYSFQSISITIVSDILQDEEYIFAGQYHHRISEFYRELKLLVPSANSLPNSPPETIDLIFNAINAGGLDTQTESTSGSTGGGNNVEVPATTSPTVTEPDNAEATDSGNEDDGGNQGGGRDKIDDKDDNPDDGDAGKGNDDRDKGGKNK